MLPKISAAPIPINFSAFRSPGINPIATRYASQPFKRNVMPTNREMASARDSILRAVESVAYSRIKTPSGSLIAGFSGGGIIGACSLPFVMSSIPYVGTQRFSRQIIWSAQKFSPIAGLFGITAVSHPTVPGTVILHTEKSPVSDFLQPKFVLHS